MRKGDKNVQRSMLTRVTSDGIRSVSIVARMAIMSFIQRYSNPEKRPDDAL